MSVIKNVSVPTYSGKTVRVENNCAGIEYKNRDKGIYLAINFDASVGLSVEGAREVAAALLAAADAYDAAKPENSEILDALGIGATIQINAENGRWLKTSRGWVSTQSGSFENSTFFNINSWTITVKYEGEK